MERLSVLLPILFGVLPSLFWFGFLLWEERVRGGRDFQILWLVFGWGMLITFPALLFEVLAESALTVLPFSPIAFEVIMAFVVVATAEEGAKFLPVWRGLDRSVLLRSPRSSMHIMIASALGFAAIENIFFAFTQGPQALPARMVTATLLHAFASGIFGLYIDQALRHPVEKRYRFLWQGFIISVLIHGVYDVLAGTSQLLPLIIFLLVLGAAVVILEIWPLSDARKKAHALHLASLSAGHGDDVPTVRSQSSSRQVDIPTTSS